MKQLLHTIIFLLFIQISSAQVISWTPRYPGNTDSLEIIFDATQGNAALSGVSQVYIHCGLITDESICTSDWQHKKTNWFIPDSLLIPMQNIGNNKHRIKIHPRNFFYIQNNENVRFITMVFRNADGSIVGKNQDESDIWLPMFNSKLAVFNKPSVFPLTPTSGQTIPIQVMASGTAMLNLYHDGNLIYQTFDSILNYNLTSGSVGKHRIWFKAQDGANILYDTLYYIVEQNIASQDAPPGTKDGINYINDSTVILQLHAPNKSTCYLIGDFNNWEMDPAYRMRKTSNGERFWIQISGLTPLKEYGFQYLVDHSINIADPYSDKFLDRWNDKNINQFVYPDLIQYPFNKTSQFVSVFQTAQQPFSWQITNFQKPDNRDLVIYELLVRDFHLWGTYKTVKDSMMYLKNLGINAIELMPVMEYDGNDSWGYMPAFYFAPDKCYGPKEDLKALIDEAHKNGIAIILDIVLNHASGNNSMARLYYNKERARPTSDNPWFNELIPHPFGYHNDWNHESYHTQAFFDRVLDYWLSEYKVDGFRFDLSKGFTNNVSVSYDQNGDIIWTDLGVWASFDQNRVNAIKRFCNNVWTNHPGTYMIMEHFADNAEEGDLAGSGCMMWCGMSANVQYSQAAKGWWNDNSDFGWAVSYKARGWWNHNLVGYMESHDEERLMWENYQWGNEFFNTGDTIPIYSCKNKRTALERMAQVAAFFFTVPGPKMMWEFGERGFDYSINWPSMTSETRTAKKPPKWDYMRDYWRVKLYKKYAALIKLRTEYPLFRTSNYELKASGWDKRIRLWDDGNVGADFAAVVVGNFDVAQKEVWPEFTHSGYWYDYFTGDSLNIESWQTEQQNFTMQFAPGEFHIYTDKKLPLPDLTVNIDTTQNFISEIPQYLKTGCYAYPNPFNEELNFKILLEKNSDVRIEIFDLSGKVVKTITEKRPAGVNFFRWNGFDNVGNQVPRGFYFYNINTGGCKYSGKIVYYGK